MIAKLADMGHDVNRRGCLDNLRWVPGRGFFFGGLGQAAVCLGDVEEDGGGGGGAVGVVVWGEGRD